MSAKGVLLFWRPGYRVTLIRIKRLQVGADMQQEEDSKFNEHHT